MGRKRLLTNDMIGERYGKLTIIGFTTVERGRQKCICKCDCGNETLASYSELIDGHKKSCGCLRVRAIDKYSYLVGQRINDWTVLELLDNRKGGIAVCRCECGTIKEVWIPNLVSGYTKDCGCGRKQMLSRTKSRDITGQRFGRLVAVENIGESNKFNRHLYRCKCDCGNEIIVPSNSLSAGHTHSCGCIRSHYNAYIGHLLDDMEIRHSAEKVVHIDGHNFRFDYYLPDYNLMIEYDGEHHYMPIPYGSMTNEEAEEVLEKRRLYDRIKDDYCEDHNINLLRIPYWEKENIEEIICNHLQRLSERDLV